MSALQWAVPAGLIITAIGIVIGIMPPSPAGMWGAETVAERAAEHGRKWRYLISVSLIAVGTLLQLPANLPD